MFPFDPFPPLFEIVNWLRSWRADRNARRQYLEVCYEESNRMFQLWLHEADKQLNTLDGYIPQRFQYQTRDAIVDLRTALEESHRIVVLGPPGSGKSTLARYITALLSGILLGKRRKQDFEKEVGPNILAKRMRPIFLQLSRCNASDLTQIPSLSGMSPDQIVRSLEKGNCFVIFDGLDEVNGKRRRAEVTDQIVDFITRYGISRLNNYFLITTRPEGYARMKLTAARFVHFHLAALDPQRQTRLVRRYLRLWGIEHWQNLSQLLIQQLNAHRELSILAGNALTLSILTYLYATKGRIPNQHHIIYQEIIEHLLSRRSDYPLSGEEKRGYRLFLGEIALSMQEQGSLSEKEMLQKIQNLQYERWFQSQNAEEVLDVISRRWGIVVSDIGMINGKEQHLFNFPQKAFAAYLSAYAIASKPDRYLSRLFDNLDSEEWNDIFMFLCSMASTGQYKQILVRSIEQLLSRRRDNVWAWLQAGRCMAKANCSLTCRYYAEVLRKLKGVIDTNSDHDLKRQCVEVLSLLPEGRRFITEKILGRARGWLSSDSFLTILRQMEDPEAHVQLQIHFEDLLHTGNLSTHERIRVAEALGQVGDHRLGAVITLKDTGKFIGKYPVTNFEYYFKYKKDYRLHWRLANHPVTGVSLDDAKRYCAWLSDKKNIEVRLPKESEWLIAASPCEQSQDNVFPWGKELRVNAMNYRDAIGSTTPVGIFPGGNSCLGVADLMGNVWEWVLGSNGRPILKGGSWNTMDREIRKGIHLFRSDYASVPPQEIGFRILQIGVEEDIV